MAPGPGDSAAVTQLDPQVGDYLTNLWKGHVFTHHPKKGTNSQNCQVDDHSKKSTYMDSLECL